MSYAEITNQEEAKERIAYLESKALELTASTVSMKYTELTKAENVLLGYRKEINSLKNKWL